MRKKTDIESVNKEIPLFKHSSKGTVKFEDVGAIGTVFENKYLYWIEWARAKYFQAIGLEIQPETFVEKYLHMVVHTEVDFFAQIGFFEDYEILTRTVFIKQSSTCIEHLIRNSKGDILVKMSAIFVFIDYRNGRPQSIPRELRQMIIEYEGNNLKIIEEDLS